MYRLYPCTRVHSPIFSFFNIFKTFFKMAAATTLGSPVLCETNFLKRVWHVHNEKYKLHWLHVYASRTVDGGVAVYSLGVWNSRSGIGEWREKNKASERLNVPNILQTGTLAALWIYTGSNRIGNNFLALPSYDHSPHFFFLLTAGKREPVFIFLFFSFWPTMLYHLQPI